MRSILERRGGVGRRRDERRRRGSRSDRRGEHTLKHAALCSIRGASIRSCRQAVSLTVFGWAITRLRRSTCVRGGGFVGRGRCCVVAVCTSGFHLVCVELATVRGG